MCENFWGANSPCKYSLQPHVGDCQDALKKTCDRAPLPRLADDQRRCFLHFFWHAPRPIFSASLSSEGLGRRSRDPSPARGAHGAQSGDVLRRYQRARLAESAWQSMLFLFGQFWPWGRSSRVCLESGRRGGFCLVRDVQECSVGHPRFLLHLGELTVTH